jgi:hypothetical protein
MPLWNHEGVDEAKRTHARGFRSVARDSICFLPCVLRFEFPFFVCVLLCRVDRVASRTPLCSFFQSGGIQNLPEAPSQYRFFFGRKERPAQKPPPHTGQDVKDGQTQPDRRAEMQGRHRRQTTATRPPEVGVADF